MGKSSSDTDRRHNTNNVINSGFVSLQIQQPHHHPQAYIDVGLYAAFAGIDCFSQQKPGSVMLKLLQSHRNRCVVGDNFPFRVWALIGIGTVTMRALEEQ